jgi:hypothetical protein
VLSALVGTVERGSWHQGHLGAHTATDTYLAELRMAHLLGAATLTGRRRAKVAELKALDPEHARVLGLNAVSYHTLIRWENARRRFGLVGCADDRWLRESGGHPSVTAEVQEAILAVRKEALHRGALTRAPRRSSWRQMARPGDDDYHGP